MASRDFPAALAALSAAITSLDEEDAGWCPVFRSDALALLLAERAEALLQTQQLRTAASDARRAVALCRHSHLGWVRDCDGTGGCARLAHPAGLFAPQAPSSRRSAAPAKAL